MPPWYRLPERITALSLGDIPLSRTQVIGEMSLPSVKPNPCSVSEPKGLPRAPQSLALTTGNTSLPTWDLIARRNGKRAVRNKIQASTSSIHFGRNEGKALYQTRREYQNELSRSEPYQQGTGRTLGKPQQQCLRHGRQRIQQKRAANSIQDCGPPHLGRSRFATLRCSLPALA